MNMFCAPARVHSALALVLGAFMLCSATRADQCFFPPPGLVGWWPGDGNARDFTGRHHGILRGGANPNAEGYVGTGFGLDGTNGFIEVPDASALRPQQLTVECWVRFDNLDTPRTSQFPGQEYLVFKQNSRNESFEAYVLSKDRGTNGDIILWEVTSAQGELVRIDSVSTVTTNVWYHLVGVRGPDYIQLYFNGELEAWAPVQFPQDYGEHPLYFGTSNQDYYDAKLGGTIDEVALYGRPLFAAEVAALYRAGHAGKCRYPPVAGVYRGLFSESAGITRDTAGAFAMTVTARSNFTGQITLAGSRHAFHGRFAQDGSATANIHRRQAAPLTIQLLLDLTNNADTVTGFVTDSNWTANLWGGRCVNNARRYPATQSGSYTLLIPGATNDPDQPAGTGYALATVTGSGRILLSGRLADGTPIARGSAISAAGEWPFFVPLYGGKGFIQGWLTFTNDPAELAGELTWLKPSLRHAKYYPAGFQFRTQAQGGFYSPPAAGSHVVDFTEGTLTFEDGNSAAPISMPVQVEANGRVRDPVSGRILLTFNRAHGAFSGSVPVPGETRARLIRGAVLQPAGYAAGYSLNTDHSIAVLLEEAPQ